VIDRVHPSNVFAEHFLKRINVSLAAHFEKSDWLFIEELGC
jgi:hypothetical protein